MHDQNCRNACKVKGFPQVRVDFYGVDGKVYFGELPFYPWSGYALNLLDGI